jgi:hypothetical protein
MTGIHDVERKQPAQDCRYEQHDEVDIKKFANEQQ